MGMSSISQLNDIYAQNVKEIPFYYEALNNGKLPTERGYRLSSDDHLRRYVITKIMCDFELNKSDVEKLFDIDFDECFADSLEELQPMVADDLVELENGRIVVTRDGRLLVRNVAMAFDAYLKQAGAENKPMYSKTV
jgi:oxygen-independent coproporphyrinogen-3 oxidase